MGSVGGEDSIPVDAPRASSKEERILVSVRFRPLNEKELDRNDESDWECTNNTTIVPKNIPTERSMFPTSYTFDRVFGSECSTRQVYEDGAKKVALSVVGGINASILAYGQTSSGKTYTMSGITEYTMSDIFDYVNKHEDREFKLKFSAMEIYNECVRDLMSLDQTPLRVLDDPERGIVVEKLTEVLLRDSSHLTELLAICEAQRQISETSLNEMSSRSHQILRLTVESFSRRKSDSNNSATLEATVNFVDLAGSERASQTLSAGVQLKEGCHINSSLLTLGSVIRRLSKGKNRHIPYRDSKLTRILQNSLGGNARTAIICTLSPARSHVEQSRNTLLFASCAKKVSGNVKVNVVTSEKELLKKLTKDLARMESELRDLGSRSDSSHSASNLKEKELLIEQMAKEIRELTEQRDKAQSHLRLLLEAGGGSRSSKLWGGSCGLSDSSFGSGSWLDDYLAFEASDVVNNLRSDMEFNKIRCLNRYRGLSSNKLGEVECDDQLLSDQTPTVFIDKYFGPDPSHGWENMISLSDSNIEDGVVEVQSIDEIADTGKSWENDEHSSSKLDENLDSSSLGEDDKIENLKLDIQDTGKSCENDEHSSSKLDENLDSSSLGEDDKIENLKLDIQDTGKSCENDEHSSSKLDENLDSSSLGEDDKIESLKLDIQDTGKSCENDEHSSSKLDENLDSSHLGEDDKIESLKLDIQDTGKSCENDEHSSSKLDENLDSSPLGEDDKIESLDIQDTEDTGKSCENDEHLSSQLNENLDSSPLGADDKIESLKLDIQDTENECDHMILDRPITPSECSSDSELTVSRSLNISRCLSFNGTMTASRWHPPISKTANESENVPLSELEKETQIRLNDDDKVLEKKIHPEECIDGHDKGYQEDNKLTSEYSVGYSSWAGSTSSEDDLDIRQNQSGNNPTSNVSPCKDKTIPRQNHSADSIVPIMEKSPKTLEKPLPTLLGPSKWLMEFESRRREIIGLWDACYVPLVHRTYFFLLFKGDTSDAVYMEVEQRRLSFLKSTLNRSSIRRASRALVREREKLSRQIRKKFSKKERREMYQKWGIKLKSKKRRYQLCRRLWKHLNDIEHVKESATLVAKLVGLAESSSAPEEIFALTMPQFSKIKSHNWRRSSGDLSCYFN